MQQIRLIAAVDQNYGIGYKNNLLFKKPEDLKMFKHITLGQIVIMGRKTFESIGKPLPNRINIVLSSDKSYAPKGVCVASSMIQAIDYCSGFKNERDVYIIGGGSLYAETINKSDGIILTEFREKATQVDTYFPSINEKIFKLEKILYLTPEIKVKYYIRHDRRTV